MVGLVVGLVGVGGRVFGHAGGGDPGPWVVPCTMGPPAARAPENPTTNPTTNPFC